MTQGKLSSAVPNLEKPMTIECPLMAPSVQFEYRYKWLACA